MRPDSRGEGRAARPVLPSGVSPTPNQRLENIMDRNTETLNRAKDLALADRILAAIRGAGSSPADATWLEMTEHIDLQCHVYGFERAKLDGRFSRLSPEPSSLRWFRALDIAREDWSNAWTRLNANLADMPRDHGDGRWGAPPECDRGPMAYSAPAGV